MTDEATIEGMVQALVEAEDEYPSTFTNWERQFIHTMADVIQNWHLTEKQEEKVSELYLRKVLRRVYV